MWLSKLEKEMTMYFQTSFRNVGLYTTVSLAMLGYSRYYRDKNANYNVVLIFCSLIVLCISFLLNTYIFNDLHSFKEKEKEISISRWALLNKGMFFVHAVLFSLGCMTLFRFLTN